MAGSTPRKTTCLKVSGINGPAMGDVTFLCILRKVKILLLLIFFKTLDIGFVPFDDRDTAQAHILCRDTWYWNWTHALFI